MTFRLRRGERRRSGRTIDAGAFLHRLVEAGDWRVAEVGGCTFVELLVMGGRLGEGVSRRVAAVRTVRLRLVQRLVRVGAV